MAPSRRLLLATGIAAPAAALAPGLAFAQATPPAAPPAGVIAPDDPRLAERGIGPADAPVKVIEYFSLTCSHCAAFHRGTYPEVKQKLVDTGRIRLIWRDFPLDALALAAAAVARSLPAERYEGFIGALFTAQDRWAFTRADPREELAKMAALAGMNRARYDAVMADELLRRAILEQRQRADTEFRIQSTPSFVFNTRVEAGEMPFATFAAHVERAARG